MNPDKAERADTSEELLYLGRDYLWAMSIFDRGYAKLSQARRTYEMRRK